MNIFAYSCTTISHQDKIEKIEDTKAYSALRQLFIAEDAIHIDILTPHIREHTQLDSILAEIKADDVLILPSISALGTPKEISLYLTRILAQRIRLLIPNYDNPPEYLDKFSLVDFGFEFVRSDAEIRSLISQAVALADDSNISSTKSLRGRRFTHEVNEEFIRIYWEYENYFITENEAMGSNSLSGMSKMTFHKLCDDYERNPNNQYHYIDNEIEQEQLYHISLKPKRHGKLPVYFDELVKMVEDGTALVEACSQLKVPYMTPITYKRYKIKTRKEMSQALYTYCRSLSKN